MFDFIYKRRIDELKKIQFLQSELHKEKRKYESFPHPTMKQYHPWLENFERTDLEDLAEQMVYLFTGITSFELFQKNMLAHCPIEKKDEYFETLGKFFLQLSGNAKELEKIKDELEKLDKREKEIKYKLGIY